MNLLLLLGTLIGAWLLRWPIATRTSLYYNSDTAILDLMARHFSRGEFCFYYWGEGYYGILDPLLLMGFFKKGGAVPAVSQLLPVFLIPVILLLFYIYLIQTETAWTALMAVAFLAWPSPYLLRITFATYNYCLGPLLGLACIVLAEKVLAHPRHRAWALALGLVSGLSWYYFRLVLFFWAGIALRFLFYFYGRRPWEWLQQQGKVLRWNSFWRRWILLDGQPLPFALKKALQFLNIANGINLSLAVLLFLHGDWKSLYRGHRIRISFWDTLQLSLHVAVLTAAVVFWRPLLTTGRRLLKKPMVKFLIGGFLIGYSPALIGTLCGFPPRSPSQFVALPVFCSNLQLFIREMLPNMFPVDGNGVWGFIYAGLILFSAWQIVKTWIAFFSALRSPRKKMDVPSALVFVGLVNLAGGLWGIVHFDVYTDRYFVPLYISLALGFAWGIQDLARRNRVLAITALLFVLGYQAQVSSRVIRLAPTTDSYQAIAQRLEELHCTGGYADYWVAYRLTAFAQEQVVVVPTGANDRYTPYLKYVQSLSQVVLLDTPIPKGQEQLTLKGQTYKILRRENIAGMSATFLEKRS